MAAVLMGWTHVRDGRVGPAAAKPPAGCSEEVAGGTTGQGLGRG